MTLLGVSVALPQWARAGETYQWARAGESRTTLSRARPLVRLSRARPLGESDADPQKCHFWKTMILKYALNAIESSLGT